jgi:hypothetical protein
LNDKTLEYYEYEIDPKTNMILNPMMEIYYVDESYTSDPLNKQEHYHELTRTNLGIFDPVQYPTDKLKALLVTFQKFEVVYHFKHQ